MAGLSSGSVPSYYLQLFNLLSTGGGNKIVKKLWKQVMETGHLAEPAMEEIWELCDPAKSNHVGRDAFYKSLALSALAQKGKTIEEKAFSNLGDKELPVPSLGTNAEIQTILTRFFRATKPTELGYTYDELKALDEIKVTLIPEKKGTLLKHNEYTVESRNFHSSVSRRYKDFEGFQAVLLQRFPFRLVPLLPPKSLISTDLFLEKRRRALKRFLLLVCRHPVLVKDDVVRYFFTVSGSDVGARMKEKFKNSPDEYVFHPLAESAQELVNDQTRMKYERIKEQITMMLKIFRGLLDVADNMEIRSNAMQTDMKEFSKELVSLSTEAILSTPWTSGGDDIWGKMQTDCRRIANEFSALSNQAGVHAEAEARGFSEGVYLFYDLLLAYQDVCERRDKFVHRKHQKALTKVQTMEKYKGHLQAQGKAMTESQESKMMKRDDDLIQIERRNFFSLLCLDLEAQLIHTNLALIPEMLHELVKVECIGLEEMLRVWEKMKPLVYGMVSRSTPTSSLTKISGAEGTTSISPTRSTSPKSKTPDISPFH